MSKKPILFARWRWGITVCAALSVWNGMRHTARHEVTGFFWPGVLTLPILWFSALSVTFLAVAGWVAWFSWRRVANPETPAA